MTSLILLLAAPDAQAWNHTNRLWKAESMPLVFYVTDYIEDSLPTSELNPTNGRLYQEEVILQGFCNWHNTDYCDAELADSVNGFIKHETAECAEILAEYGGISPGNEGNQNDGVIKIYFDDPKDEHATGVNAVNITPGGGSFVKELLGEQYFEPPDSDIVFNNDVDWGRDVDIEAGCSNETSIESTGTHEIGHLLGMAHSCEQTDICALDSELNATMYWSGGRCETSRSDINSDDLAGINVLYGPYVVFALEGGETAVSGPSPLETCFVLESEDETLDSITSIAWNFGDGETDTTEEPCHTYTEQGQYSVSMKVSGELPDCGEWKTDQIEQGIVLVCEPPVPAFEVAHTNGLTYQMVNTTDVSTYGCVDGIQWAIYKGGSADGDPLDVLGAWSPKYDFPEAGTYTVALLAQGPAGEDTIESSFEVEDKRGEGVPLCSTTPRTGGPVGALALLVIGLLRRRRD